MSAAPLTGYRILEIGHMLSGPYCGMLLADMGAEVIKIEMPPHGDIARGLGAASVDGFGTYFASLNRGKKSICLDIATPEGRAQLEALVATADGLVTNLRPGAIRKLRLTYDDLCHIRPDLACLALTGFGLDGPDADRPAYDYVVQAMIGLMNLTGDPGAPPTKTGYSVVDNSTGIMAAFALVSLILGGRGGQADVSLYDTMMSQMNYLAGDYLNSGTPPRRMASGSHPFIVPAQIFETRDGHVTIFISHDRFWELFARGIGREDWIADPVFATAQARSANRAQVVAELAEVFRTRTTEEWVGLLAPLGIVIAAVGTLEAALESDLCRARELVVDIPLETAAMRLLGLPFRVAGLAPSFAPPPRLGEHNHMLDALAPASSAAAKPAPAASRHAP